MNYQSKEKSVENRKEAVAKEEAPVPVVETKKVKKKQIELNDDNLAYLGKRNYSNAAWEAVAKVHSFEPGTQERAFDENDRVYYATHKDWKQEVTVAKAGPLSTGGR